MKKQKLHTIAPILCGIARGNACFKIPDNYFASLEEKVIDKMKTKKIKIKRAPSYEIPSTYFENIENIVLSKLKAESLQNNSEEQIPKNYFAGIEDKVMHKIKASRKVISLKKALKFVAPLAIAASLLLIFTLRSNSKTISFESFGANEIEYLIDEGFIDIDLESLTLNISDAELATIEFIPNLSEEEVLNYLVDENIETIIFDN